jgi:RHS repeat-associated protein
MIADEEAAYSDGVTPEVDFVYDQPAPGIGGVQALSNVNGRLAYAFTPNSTTDVYSYDSMGRVTDLWQCVTAPCTSPWHAQQVYDLGGDMTSLAYNGGTPLIYAYDRAQRITGISGVALPNLTSPLLSNVTYGPVGLLSATLGTGAGALPEARTYNNRTWLNCLQVGTPLTGCTASVYSLEIPTNPSGYSGNGNLTHATDSVNGDWSYTYDDFNRLATANTPPTNPTLAYSYSYDRFGNRWAQTVTHGTGLPVALSFDGKNRITTEGYFYDAAGNLVMDNLNCYTYDAENRLTSVAPETAPGSDVCGATTMSYLYDPDGRRVARLQGGAVVKQYFYDAGGRMITEADPSGNTLRAEIYAGNRHLATWTSGATFFNHADWLGTERARSRAADGTRCETITSLPFGDGLSTAGSCGDPSPNHFTGKERDAESGLDNFGARYNASNLGRFMSPDPSNLSVDFWVPSTWNRYSYTLNNPLGVVDRNGEWPTKIHNEIINEAFPGMSAQDLQTLKDASYNMDYGPGQQDPSLSFEHSMSNGVAGETASGAEQEAEGFITRSEDLARSVQAEWIATGHTGIAPAALTAFGNALHTIVDATSPSHRGFQAWYGKWNWRTPLHLLRERRISPEQRNNAVAAARAAFRQTFGDEFDWMLMDAQRRQPPENKTPREVVTSRLCGGPGQPPCAQ